MTPPTTRGAVELPEAVTHGLRRKGKEAIIGVIPNNIAARPAAGAKWMEDMEEIPLYTRAQMEAYAASRADAAGFVLVPVEPTPEMCKAGGFHEWSGGFDRNGSHSAGEYVEYTHSLEHAFGTYGCEGAAAEVWAAMLAAAPAEPQEVRDEQRR